MNKLILSAISMLISSAVIAYEASPGVVPVEISHICTGFKECGVHSDGYKKKFSMSPKFVSAIVLTHDMSGSLFSYLMADSYHKVLIRNESSDTKRYQYRYRLQCLLGVDDRTFQVDLKPNQFFGDDIFRFATLYLEVEGTFPITASTSIIGPEGIVDEKVSTLTVY